MAATIRRTAYFNATVPDEAGEGYRLLGHLAEEGVNLLAFRAVPVGPANTQLALFPEDEAAFQAAAQKAGLSLEGPHPALLVVQGDDELGALADVHRRLSDCEVSVYASSGVADGKGGYGCVLYLRPEEFDKAAAALEL